MKKLLGISLVAVLAVSPMMAMADPAAAASKVEETGAGIATVSYVKGAYNAAVDVVGAEETRAKGVEGTLNNLSETIKSDLNTKNQDVNLVNAINSVASAASDAYQLKANSNVTTAGNYITTGTGVAANLGLLDTATKAAADAAAAAQGDADALETRMGTAEGNISSLGTRMTTAEGDISTLQGQVSGLNSNSATKEGVVATVEKATVTGAAGSVTGGVSGDVTVYTTWGDETVNGQSSVALNNGTITNGALTGGTVSVSSKYYSSSSDTGTVQPVVTTPAQGE